jgi:uracil-DNA glycosylase
MTALTMGDLTYCAKTYTLPQIEIVQPRMVLCLGKQTFVAVQCALCRPLSKLREALLPHESGAEIYGVPHTGSWGTKNAGGIKNVDAIWARLADRFAGLRASSGLRKPPKGPPS